MLLQFILSIIFAYIVLILIMFLMQRRLLYMPHKGIPFTEAMQELKFWPQLDNYRGMLSIDNQTTAKGTVIVFHGNSSTAANGIFYVRALTPLGYRVVLAEYPGYGGRAGKLSEASIVTDAKITVALVQRQFDGPFFLLGESLGSAVASAIVADPNLSISGVILLTPFDSLSELVKTRFWYIPARWLLWDTFDNVNNLASFEGPVAVALAEQDKIVPWQHGIRLYESLSGRKKLWTFKDAGHADWPASPKEAWWKEMMDFVSEKSWQQQDADGTLSDPQAYPGFVNIPLPAKNADRKNLYG